MKKILLSGAILCILFSCNDREAQLKKLYDNTNESLIQQRNAGGFMLTATYLPVNWEYLLGGDNPDAREEMSFKLEIVPPKEMPDLARGVSSFSGTDTLFSLITDRDTFPAIAAQVVAGGSLMYLVTFKRSALENTSTAHLVFKDWLHTHHLMQFPFEVQQMNNIDSLSNRL